MLINCTHDGFANLVPADFIPVHPAPALSANPHPSDVADNPASMVGLSTSALAGDLDLNPRVFSFLIAILGSAPVSATG